MLYSRIAQKTSSRKLGFPDVGSSRHLVPSGMQTLRFYQSTQIAQPLTFLLIPDINQEYWSYGEREANRTRTEEETQRTWLYRPNTGQPVRQEGDEGDITMASLTANPDLVIVDPNAGQVWGNTEIEYDKAPSNILWHRIGPSSTTPWRKVQLDPKNTAEELEQQKREGKFTSPQLLPGRLYQVLIMRGDFDPNRSLPEGVEAAVDVLCLLKNPENRDLIGDQNGPVVGGTFYWHRITAKKDPLLMQLVVGGRAPDRDADGILSFSEVLASTPTMTELTQDKELEVTGLLPGNPHFSFIRVSDAKGNWQFLEDSFTTLQRKTTVRIQSMYIGNDGDPFANSSAEFDFEILVGSNNPPRGGTTRSVKTFNWSDDDISDGKQITLNFQHTLGPERISPDNRLVFVNIRGEEFDGIGESNEYASNEFFSRALSIPQGKGQEVVLDQERSMWAKPENDDFNFTARVFYSVEYV